MLKIKVTKEEYDALPEGVKTEYKASGDLYILDVEGYEDPGELRRARDREKQAAKDAREEADRLKREAEEAKNNNARNTGDIAALEKSWKEKRDADVKEREDKLKKKDAWAEKQLKEAVAEKIAAELSDSPKVLLPHIKARLSADLSSDDPTTIVLDANGQRSALTVAELVSEFRASPDFAAIIRGSKASGAGGGGGGRGAGGSKNPKEMNDAERIKLNKENPAEFNRLFGETQFGA